jgi:excisionase family DNA binding protein
MPVTAPEKLLTTGDVAALYRVDAKSVARWVKNGKLTAVRTPGGRLRFREAEIRALLNPETQS